MLMQLVIGSLKFDARRRMARVIMIMICSQLELGVGESEHRDNQQIEV